MGQMSTCVGMKTWESDVKPPIVRVKNQMQIFNYFCTSLVVLLIKNSYSMSKTLQHKFMSAVEGLSVCAMTVETMRAMRSDEQFKMFRNIVTLKAKALKVPEPFLSCKHKRPRGYEEGEAEPYFPDFPKPLHRSVYFDSLDAIINCTERRFREPGYHILWLMEALLVKAV